jgi:hypothetical protein
MQYSIAGEQCQLALRGSTRVASSPGCWFFIAFVPGNDMPPVRQFIAYESLYSGMGS